MNVKNKMSAKPPQPATPEAFIHSAEHNPATPAGGYPWEAPHVRDDVIKAVNLRLPEAYILKLQFLSEQTNKSQQAILRDILLPAIDAAVKRY